MNKVDFEVLLNRRLERTKNVLAAKNKEYASDTDRLHNFKVAARIGQKEETPEKALLGMWKKHLVSIFDIVESIETTVPSQELLDEKIGDVVNYAILLEALITERMKEVRHA